MRTVGSPPTILSVRKIRRGALTFICPAPAPCAPNRQVVDTATTKARVPTFTAAANAHARQAVPEKGGLRTIGNRTRLIQTPVALRVTVNGQHDRLVFKVGRSVREWDPPLPCGNPPDLLS